MNQPVYRHLDRETLDREYNARDSVPDFTIFLKHYAELSANARRDLPCITDIAYGPHKAQDLDLFPAGPGVPLFVYIHGGYWRLLGKEDSAFMAPAFTANGIAVCALNYALVPSVTLDDIVAQCRQGIAWLFKNAAEFGINPDRIFVGGSSAGGHLAAMLAADSWQEDSGIPLNTVKGALSASGLFDLEPVRLSHINTWMQLDEVSAYRNSPIHHLPRSGCPFIISYGGEESAEFKRQSDEFADQWKAHGFPCQNLNMPGRNHFDVILELANPQSPLAKAVFDMIL